jgi:hypothetical protein
MSPWGWRFISKTCRRVHVYGFYVNCMPLLVLCEVDCFCALWNEIFLQSFNVFYTSKQCFCSTENNLFMLLMIFLSLLLIFKSSLNQISVLHWKWVLKIVTVLAVPINVLCTCKLTFWKETLLMTAIAVLTYLLTVYRGGTDLDTLS